MSAFVRRSERAQKSPARLLEGMHRIDWLLVAGSEGTKKILKQQVYIVDTMKNST